MPGSIDEDEHGSGEVGLKQGITGAGCIPLVAVDGFKLDREDMRQQLQHQANVYRKTIRLCRFVCVEELVTLEPEEIDDHSRKNGQDS